jgi:hypothetical protein
VLDVFVFAFNALSPVVAVRGPTPELPRVAAPIIDASNNPQ